LTRPGRAGRLMVVVTCRSDEVPLDAHVAEWLAHVRGSGAVTEIRLGPLSRGEVAEQVTFLAGRPLLPPVADELFARGEGNPFFTEQLVAAAMPAMAEGMLRLPAGLPARLAELLSARASRCGEDGRAMLEALAVAGRPLTEAMLVGITGLEPDAVRRGLRELVTSRLLAGGMTGDAHRLRHALLGEAVTAGLLPGERALLHERTAGVLDAAGDDRLAAEAAGHWAAAGRGTEELAARMAAGSAAERVFAYAQAAAHWLRAIVLCQELPGAAKREEIDVPRMYVRAIDALEVSGDSERAGSLAEEAYRRYAAHPDSAAAALIHLRVAEFRALEQPAAATALSS
jgi:hypothetical protein